MLVCRTESECVAFESPYDTLTAEGGEIIEEEPLGDIATAGQAANDTDASELPESCTSRSNSSMDSSGSEIVGTGEGGSAGSGRESTIPTSSPAVASYRKVMITVLLLLVACGL